MHVPQMANTIFVLTIVSSWLCLVQPYLTDNGDWESFKRNHGKAYDSIEDEYRLSIFMRNTAYIASHNSKARNGEYNFTLAMNKFGDLTNEEFSAFLNDASVSRRFLKPAKHSTWNDDDVPDSMDWRDRGRVTPVQDQGTCSSSWAFSVAGAIEGLISKGVLTTLSAQNLIDCSMAYGTQACNGGWTFMAFDYAIDNGGIDTADSYPYTGELSPCHFLPGLVGGFCTGYEYVLEGDENGLKSACGLQGPVSVTVDGSLDSFKFYENGTYYDPACSSENLNYAALLVGYNTNADGDYWIVKSSMGEDWGQDGYIFMSRNRGNNCGIASEALYPFL